MLLGVSASVKYGALVWANGSKNYWFPAEVPPILPSYLYLGSSVYVCLYVTLVTMPAGRGSRHTGETSRKSCCGSGRFEDAVYTKSHFFSLFSLSLSQICLCLSL